MQHFFSKSLAIIFFCRTFVELISSNVHYTFTTKNTPRCSDAVSLIGADKPSANEVFFCVSEPCKFSHNGK